MPIASTTTLHGLNSVLRAGLEAELEDIPQGEHPNHGTLTVWPEQPLAAKPFRTMDSSRWGAVHLVRKYTEKAFFQDFKDSMKNYTVFGLFASWAGLIQAPHVTEN